MKRPNMKAAAAEHHGPNRLLLALAAAWMILSIAIGGALWNDSRVQAAAPAPAVGTASQP